MCHRVDCEAMSEESGAPGSWSRRITDVHRRVYLVDDEDLVIVQARYRY